MLYLRAALLHKYLARWRALIDGDVDVTVLQRARTLNLTARPVRQKVRAHVLIAHTLALGGVPPVRDHVQASTRVRLNALLGATAHFSGSICLSVHSTHLVLESTHVAGHITVVHTSAVDDAELARTNPNEGEGACLNAKDFANALGRVLTKAPPTHQTRTRRDSLRLTPDTLTYLGAREQVTTSHSAYLRAARAPKHLVFYAATGAYLCPFLEHRDVSARISIDHDQFTIIQGPHTICLPVLASSNYPTHRPHTDDPHSPPPLVLNGLLFDGLIRDGVRQNLLTMRPDLADRDHRVRLTLLGGRIEICAEMLEHPKHYELSATERASTRPMPVAPRHIICRVDDLLSVLDRIDFTRSVRRELHVRFTSAPARLELVFGPDHSAQRALIPASHS